jgi:hypothetical protein
MPWVPLVRRKTVIGPAGPGRSSTSRGARWKVNGDTSDCGRHWARCKWLSADSTLHTAWAHSRGSDTRSLSDGHPAGWQHRDSVGGVSRRHRSSGEAVGCLDLSGNGVAQRLTRDVWQPATPPPPSGRPIMVYFHGGGLLHGAPGTVLQASRLDCWLHTVAPCWGGGGRCQLQARCSGVPQRSRRGRN